ncbi:MAG: histidine kinase [Sphingomonadaceae bacterium]|nr:histidine kinase [Sphingomonadaceae bacterium]
MRDHPRMREQDRSPARASIALVDGDATIRHARQLLLRAQGSDVRAYPSCAAALADPMAIASDCVVADVDMGAIGGIDLLRLMRGKGWHGEGILLADVVPPALRMIGLNEGFVVMRPAALDDRRLLMAVDVALRRPVADYA